MGPSNGSWIRIPILTLRCAQGRAQRRVRIFYGFLCLGQVRILDSDPESWILTLNLGQNMSESRITILTPRCAQGVGAQRRRRCYFRVRYLCATCAGIRISLSIDPCFHAYCLSIIFRHPVRSWYLPTPWIWMRLSLGALFVQWCLHARCRPRSCLGCGCPATGNPPCRGTGCFTYSGYPAIASLARDFLHPRNYRGWRGLVTQPDKIAS